MADIDPDIVTLYESRSRQRCLEFALVLDAVGLRCDVLSRDGLFALAVDARDAEAAREQLNLYRREQAFLPPRVAPPMKVHDGVVVACLYGMAILLVDTLQRNQAFALDWWQAGISQAGLIRAGEWWRAVTALGLHADGVHLAGNLLFGLIFGFLLGAALGWGLALSGMLLAGALGNALNALLQPWDHTSVGASTAVFATVGMLATDAWQRRRRRIDRWVPLGGGVALLAFLGMSGERTDLLAHVAGFASGCLFGLAFAWLDRHALPARWLRHVLGLAAILVFALSWTVALRAHG